MGEQLHCLLRKTWVAATKEELVRQKILYNLIHLLDFLPSCIAVEKELSKMPHLALENQHLPLRRADILCYGKDIHPEHSLYPLLLIECKAVKLNSKVINQACGYNHFLRAYFVCVANATEAKTGWYDPLQKGYVFIAGLPKYQELKDVLGNRKLSI